MSKKQVEKQKPVKTNYSNTLILILRNETESP